MFYDSHRIILRVQTSPQKNHHQNCNPIMKLEETFLIVHYQENVEIRSVFSVDF